MRRTATTAPAVFLLVVQACDGQAATVSPRATSATTSTPKSSPAPSLADGSTAATIGHVTRAAAMSLPRAVHTATALGDGRILIAGGCTNDGCDLGSRGGATAEVFDPVAGVFKATGGLTVSRDDHAASLMADGRVMLIGGWSTSGVLASTDIYDPSSGAFSPGPTMHSARAGLVPVALDDGRLLLAGGFVENRPTTASSELFDPATGVMTPTGDMTTARGAYAAARLRDGRVFIAGGLSAGIVTASAELYDPASGAFTPTGAMRIARYKGGAALLPDGTVLVFGGSGDIDGTILYASTELYDPATGSFSAGPTMQAPRYKLPDASVVLDGGDILVAGGAPRPEVFRATSRAFIPVEGSLDATRLFLAAARIDGHRVLLTGGYDRAIRPTAATWLFDAR